MKNRKSK